MRAYVHYNLHRHCWSVRDTKTKRVSSHCDSICLADCRFVVSQAGRRRVLAERRKNVHAGVVGEVIPQAPQACTRRVRYNPYECDTFFDAGTGEAVYEAEFAVMDGGRVYIPEGA